MESNDRYYISGSVLGYYTASPTQWLMGQFVRVSKVGSWKTVFTLVVL